MKVNFSTPIKSLSGENLVENGKEITLASVSCTALIASFPDEMNLSGDEKVRRYSLALKIFAGGEQDLSIEDLGSLRSLISKGFGPLVVGRVREILDVK